MARKRWGEPTKDYAVEAALGNIPGVTCINKFGETLDADAGAANNTDAWDGADGVTSTKLWVMPTQARVHAIVSTSDVDSAAGGVVAEGNGAHTVRVYGLKDWDTAETNEDITLDGTTSVNTSDSYVIIHRMEILTYGSDLAQTGIITATAATDGTVTAAIQPHEGDGQGQTQMAIYGVPSTQTLLVTHLEGGTEGSVGILARLMVKLNADLSTSGFNNKYSFKFTDTSSGSVQIPRVFAGPCIVKIEVQSDTNNSPAHAAFDGFLVTTS